MTNPKGIQVAIMGHSALLCALALTHPDRAALLAAFAQEIQKAIDSVAEDAEVSGLLTSFEEYVRSLIAT